jgi:hypothetical protein
MEASEELNFSEAGSVRLIDDRLVIERLVVDDERTARVVRERAKARHDPPATVRDAIEIGARVLEREGTAAEVDYVKAEFGRQAGELGQRLLRSIESGNELLAEEIAKSFGADRTGTVQQQIKQMLDETSESQRDGLLRQFSAQDGTNPLFDFKDAVVRAITEGRERQERESVESRKRIEALTREIVELKERQQADRRVADAEEAGTRKGRSFEERVHDALESIAEARGDAAFHVGDEPGKGGSKKGDTVIEVEGGAGPALGRIVFEAKNKKLGKREAWDELDAAIAEREASYGVLVVAGEERIPAGRQQLHEYEGSKLIVAVDPEAPEGIGLELAYRYARCRIVLEREGELMMDGPAVRDAAAEALSALKQAQSIKLNLTKAESGITSARVGLEEMADAVKQRLERIESLVASAADAD